ncbi:N-fatty-acyl-amino acid synthase/hydrolase PM20D1.1 [Hondaea fermentalgiana]|uniref:N-fatty-acyl-amino acid synthase/hydrolase PM20D1.1 n=1 Tax=Hondaea fermentalgiana TaxID=2315210 RepID=A0A2R5GB65_9STRA|nr:N-fatty-acyl-amino acid synthase/hydrolase PM20D1.1 [Hondaea fermentalgiana]|eukprot:GBG27569.1 N-fatty-acyl-amino acid synthase/hydrolase PM20D1.1 [Hondaea fermentalgiana]
MTNAIEEHEAAEVDFFRELLRFRTVSAEGPVTGAYRDCVEWLEKRVKELVPIASTQIVEAVEKKPILVVEVRGEDPSLDAILLNSHYDVVPAMDEHWDIDPWAAIEKDGRIYGRGTQDMKCVCAQYVLSLARAYRAALENADGDASKVSYLFKRSIWLTFVPDEEIGGKDGMGAFIRGGHLENIIGKVAVALDEGLANDKEEAEYTVFYGERMPMWVLVKCEGPTGHGSRFIQNTAVEKLITMANKAFAKRREQEQILGATGEGCKHCEAKKLGDVLTINLTALQAGPNDKKERKMTSTPTESKTQQQAQLHHHHQQQQQQKRLSSRLASVSESKSDDDQSSARSERSESSVDFAMPEQCAEGGLNLEITQNPLQVFWKDEGGRGNYLTATATVRGVEQYGKVTIIPSLMYENFAEVEDAEEILRVISVEPKMVTRSGQRVTVKFRIEKVSRRKDGRKFRLSLGCDKEGALAERACTSPVMVLSKRKSQAAVLQAHNGYRAPAGTPARKTSGVKRKAAHTQRRSSLPVTKVEHQQHMHHHPQHQAHMHHPQQAPAHHHVAQLDALRTTVGALESKLSALVDRVIYLEKENKRQAIALAESFRAPEPEPVSSPSTHAFEDDFGEWGMDNTNPDLSFNFGLPSGAASPAEF